MTKQRIQVSFETDTFIEIKVLADKFNTSMSKVVEQVTLMGLQSYAQGLPQLPDDYKAMSDAETLKFLLRTALNELEEYGENQAK
jgi:hypothetical protein